MRKERARDIKWEYKILNVQKRYKYYVHYERIAFAKIKYNKEYVHYGVTIDSLIICKL